MKLETIFLCSNCDAQSPKWAGRCGECGAWGTLTEGIKEGDEKKTVIAGAEKTIPFDQIQSTTFPRIKTGISELDQVLGGGIVPGSLILLGGEPGIGKSSLILQIAINLASKTLNLYPATAGRALNTKVLYCSGEESAEQVKMRYDRFTNTKPSSSLVFLGETIAEKITSTIISEKPALAIIDSIQTISSMAVPSEAGSVAQVRACTVQFLETAKKNGIPIIITGHVTKEGMVAGPKTLEHLVDTVLYLEGDAAFHFRLLKTVKNRFGSTNEIGVFEMADTGLREVANPSEVFISKTSDAPGTVTTVVLEGSRAFLLQVQALVSKTYFGYPQRRSVGFDLNRLQLLIAVAIKRLGLNLGDQDIHVNIVGGFKVAETACDLAIIVSIVSAYKNKTVEPDKVIFGEVGLSGEVRVVSQMDKRLKEAEKLGFTRAIIPVSTKLSSKLTLQQIKSIQDLEI